MKLLRTLCSLILPLVMLSPAGLAKAPDPGQVSISVGRLLEQYHYSRQKLDSDVSSKLIRNYLEALDYSRLFFTQKDIDTFVQKYGDSLDDDILLGNPAPAIEIFDLYKQRVESRLAKVQKLIANQKFDFKSNRTVLINRQKAAWPKDEAEADQLWKDRIEGEILQQKLARKKPEKTAQKAAEPKKAAEKGGKTPAATVDVKDAKNIDSPTQVLTRRYNQILRNIREQTKEDAIDIFLSTLAQTYDPHSEYLSKSEMENFNISMKLSLVGIGAVLHSEDGYAKIMELVTGGPAQKDGRLKVGDRVSAVAQDSGEFVDVVEMKLDKVVAMIRGKKGTTVRLQVIPAAASDPSAQKVIDIVRDEVKLKDQAAKAEIIEMNDAAGSPRRLGWITLPSFYADMEHPGMKGAKSTTSDVRLLLERLKKEGISGLVIDLRRNGGGSLEEAVNLTGLFIKRGPVVQAKSANGRTTTLRSRDNDIAYSGPLVVLTNTLSASASEIFAAALQDYGRAVVVGDKSTFGKGTVQTMLDISRFIPFLGGSEGEAGSLKLTIQKFYRVAGGSTQLHGVASDIVIPSPYAREDIGEGSLKEPLPYDEVEPAAFDKVNQPLFLEELRTRSAARISAEPEFKYIQDDMARMKKKLAENSLSLNEKARNAEIARDKDRRTKRLAERAKRKLPEIKDYIVTLDNVSNPELELVKNDLSDEKGDAAAKVLDPEAAELDEDEAAGDEKTPRIDPVRNEALSILNDLVDLSVSQKTARVVPSEKTPEP